jgi:hypothetical protein
MPLADCRGLLLVLTLAGCATPPEIVPYHPPAAGPQAQLTVKTARMWSPNRVTLYLASGAEARPARMQVIGQLQSGDYVKREILSFDARLAAGAPLALYFEYRYDLGAALETGCNYPVTLTFAPGGRYLVDFIKDPHSCRPRFYVVGADGALSEMPAK